MFLRSNWPGLAWALFLLILSGVPGNYIPHVITFREWMHPDKIVHLLVYGIFVWLLIRGFRKQSAFNRLKKHASVISLIIGIVFGLMTEVMQAYIFTGRSGSIYDWFADILGCLLGWLVYLIFFKGKKVML